MTRASLKVGYAAAFGGLFLAAFALGWSQFSGWSIAPGLVGVFSSCWGFGVIDAHRGLE